MGRHDDKKGICAPASFLLKLLSYLVIWFWLVIYEIAPGLMVGWQPMQFRP
jgi:hypothetical protein